VTVVANPLLPGCYPDPSICRVGEDYYLVTSTFEYLPGLPVHRSRDLVSWEQIGHVVDRPGMLDYAGIASSGGLYAPTLRHHDGLFWLVCTLIDQRDGTRGGNFLMTAQDAAGPWSDPVWLDADGIDPSIFFDDDGRVWLHGTRLAREPQWHDQTEVWVRELDPVSRTLVGPEHVIWNGAVLGAVWAEGPHLYRVGDAYHLLAAEGGTEFHHAVSVARADRVTGPYTGSRANPVLTHRHLGQGTDVVGVGHADLVQAVDGSWWAVLLGMRPYGGYHYPLGRETFLVPVEWQDGWPVLAPGVGRVPATVDVPFAGPWRPGVTQGRTSGVIRPDDLRWTAVRALPTEVASPLGDGWSLPVRPAGLADLDVPAFLGLRQQHQDLDLHVTLRADLVAGEEAGIAARQSERDHVRLSVGAAGVVGSGATGALGVAGSVGTAGDAEPAGNAEPAGTWGRRVSVVHRAAGEETLLGETVLVGDSDAPVTLVLRARGADYALLAAIGDAEPVLVAHADPCALDSVSTGGFLGVWLGVHASSGGRPTTSVVAVERLEYRPLA
jgi:xylan 1,4-beta-xylosidase